MTSLKDVSNVSSFTKEQFVHPFDLFCISAHTFPLFRTLDIHKTAKWHVFIQKKSIVNKMQNKKNCADHLSPISDVLILKFLQNVFLYWAHISVTFGE